MVNVVHADILLGGLTFLSIQISNFCRIEAIVNTSSNVSRLLRNTFQKPLGKIVNLSNLYGAISMNLA